ncbi:MAG TPA: TonB-dependent receptor, partial [Chryseosolibacter sp.]|nr:TonB-dependent receptor [Chryseosolibacter sp.]
PYKVTVTFLGNETLNYGGIYLKLGEPYNVSASMKESSGVELAEIVISATEDRILNSERNGAITSISNREIQTLPTITRSINDMTRLTPQASSTSTGSIGGGNYRQNYITVDGSDFNNTFGIGTNLPAGGAPISLDALEEISVNVTPYDIRQSGFIGSSINAVTRSGTNEFSGSVYTFFRNEGLQGNKVADNDAFTKQNLQVNTYGFRLGGPILKNKLFFFFNAETGKTISPGQQNVAATADRPFDPTNNPNVARPTATDLDAISDYLRTNYGYETGPYEGYDFESENTRFTGRLDWNITNNHRFSARYSQVESKSPSFVSTSRSPLSGYSSSAGRTSINALWFKNSNYYQDANFYSFAAELNSSLFGGKFFNTLRGTFTHQNDPRSSDSQVFPFVDILSGGTPFTSFGYEPFTFGNLRDVKTYSVVDNLTWTSGNHNFTAGLQFDLSSTKNGFQRFATSYYTFNSWNDFISGANPRDFAITYSLLPGFEQAFPRFKFAQYSIYAQDEIQVNSRLRVTGGLRVDLPSYLDVKEIRTHPLVAGLAFEGGETIDTGVLPDTKVLFSPRAGFNWDVQGDRSLQVRGGSGIFTGRVPTVWIVSQSGDAGLLQFTQTFAGQANTPGPFNPDPTAYRPAAPPEAGTAIPSTISAIDQDFKFPQTWKTSLAVDKKLPWGVVGTFEAIFNKDLNVALGRNPNLVTPQSLSVDGYPDNRPIYPQRNTDKFLNPLISGQPVAPGTLTSTGGDASAFNPVILDNASNKGYYFSLTAKLDKQFANGISAMLAYTGSSAKNIYDGSGDQLLNTWSLTPIIGNANNPELSYANYVVPHRVIASVSYRIEYARHAATQIALFFEGSTYGRFSYTYSSDFNRDGQTNDLIYVPKDETEITFAPLTVGSTTYTPEEQSTMFFDYIEQDDYLKRRKGLYAERNGAKYPWRNQVDLRIAQDVFMNIGGKKNTVQVTLDIFNFGNLLNKNWGVVKQLNANALLTPANTSSLVADGTVEPTFRLATFGGQPVTKTFRDNNSIASTYYMQFGIRYIFN